MAEVRARNVDQSADELNEEDLVDFADFGENLQQLFPFLVQEVPFSMELSSETPDSVSFKNKLIELQAKLPDQHTVYGGFTNGRFESFGIIIYRNPDDKSKIQEIVYFDSHDKLVNGTHKACAKHFHNLDDAAAFLAKRTSYEAVDPSEPRVAPGIFNNYPILHRSVSLSIL